MYNTLRAGIGAVLLGGCSKPEQPNNVPEKKEKDLEKKVEMIKKAKNLNDKERIYVRDLYERTMLYYQDLESDADREKVKEFKESDLTEDDLEKIKIRAPWINPEYLTLPDKILILQHKLEIIVPQWDNHGNKFP